MQLGARWSVGAEPHRSVPSGLHEVIRELELTHPGAGSWTLTWLEGRPRLALDQLAFLRIDPDGAIVVQSDADRGGDARFDGNKKTDEADGDDDDWLS